MNDFESGDVVKVTSNIGGNLNRIGIVLKEQDNSFDYLIDFGNETDSYFYSCLELVQKGPNK